ncbi:hypothetical protein A0J61_07329 [Choanephora cucurbitarum]|uniref:C2H2-type domain-containing protein n=1 Tax=Choanephora cucurbitarum TaxID=101091 RepID=A0A1C7N665_9FUNG|nr:hypothetical protein A0J61_07329 [Choanephora cucurbitarum]
MSLNQQPQNAPKRRRIVQSSLPNTSVIDFSVESSYRCQYCNYQTSKRSNFDKHMEIQHPIVDLTTDVDQQGLPRYDSRMRSSDVVTEEYDWDDNEDSNDDDVKENEDNYTQEPFDEYLMPSEENIPDFHHPSYPFESPQHFLCHAFFDVKKIMSFVRQIVNLTSDNDFTLPSDNKIIDFAKSVRSNIPISNTTEHEATIAKTKFYMNKPSKYIKHLMANCDIYIDLKIHIFFIVLAKNKFLIISDFYARLAQHPNGEQHYMKVQIIPYVLYTDKTFSNTSKQYNKFDSVQMIPAALPISERNKRENMHFVLT